MSEAVQATFMTWMAGGCSSGMEQTFWLYPLPIALHHKCAAFASDIPVVDLQFLTVVRQVSGRSTTEVKTWATPKQGGGREFGAGIAAAKVLLYASRESGVYAGDATQPPTKESVPNHPMLTMYADGKRPELPQVCLQNGAISLPSGSSDEQVLLSDLDGGHRLMASMEENEKAIRGVGEAAVTAKVMKALWRVAVNVLFPPLETVKAVETICKTSISALQLSQMLRQYAMMCASELNLATRRTITSTGASEIVTVIESYAAAQTTALVEEGRASAKRSLVISPPEQWKHVGVLSEAFPAANQFVIAEVVGDQKPLSNRVLSMALERALRIAVMGMFRGRLCLSRGHGAAEHLAFEHVCRLCKSDSDILQNGLLLTPVLEAVCRKLSPESLPKRYVAVMKEISLPLTSLPALSALCNLIFDGVMMFPNGEKPHHVTKKSKCGAHVVVARVEHVMFGNEYSALVAEIAVCHLEVTRYTVQNSGMPTALQKMLLSRRPSRGTTLEDVTMPAFALAGLRAVAVAQVSALVGFSTPSILSTSHCLRRSLPELQSMDAADFGADYMRLMFPESTYPAKGVAVARTVLSLPNAFGGTIRAAAKSALKNSGGPAIAQEALPQLRQLFSEIAGGAFDSQFFSKFDALTHEAGDDAPSPAILAHLAGLDALAPHGRQADRTSFSLLGRVLSILTKATEKVHGCEVGAARRFVYEGAVGWGDAMRTVGHPFACSILIGRDQTVLWARGLDWATTASTTAEKLARERLHEEERVERERALKELRDDALKAKKKADRHFKKQETLDEKAGEAAKQLEDADKEDVVQPLSKSHGEGLLNDLIPVGSLPVPAPVASLGDIEASLDLNESRGDKEEQDEGRDDGDDAEDNNYDEERDSDHEDEENDEGNDDKEKDGDNDVEEKNGAKNDVDENGNVQGLLGNSADDVEIDSKDHTATAQLHHKEEMTGDRDEVEEVLDRKGRAAPAATGEAFGGVVAEFRKEAESAADKELLDATDAFLAAIKKNETLGTQLLSRYVISLVDDDDENGQSKAVPNLTDAEGQQPTIGPGCAESEAKTQAVLAAPDAEQSPGIQDLKPLDDVERAARELLGEVLTGSIDERPVGDLGDAAEEPLMSQVQQRQEKSGDAMIDIDKGQTQSDSDVIDGEGNNNNAGGKTGSSELEKSNDGDSDDLPLIQRGAARKRRAAEQRTEEHVQKKQK